MIFTNLTFAYEGKLIFDNLTFELPRGISLVSGPSGCGKTTLLKIIAGISKPATPFCQATDGRSLLIVQEDSLLPWLSGWENIMFFLSHHGVDSSEIRAHPLYALVEDHLDRPVWKLSYGQRRTIEILRALLSKPNLLGLDEPYNYLDQGRRQKITDTLVGATNVIDYIVVATHEPEDLVAIASEWYQFPGMLPVSTLHRVSRDCYPNAKQVPRA
jgi:ABC-type multidrug transport system ATPase subunit